jgi:O-antigen ligase
MAFVGERTHARMRVCLNAYTTASVVCSFIAILSFLNLFGFEKLTTIEGRVAGTFKDPNVFGSYLTLAAAYLMQTVLLRRGAVLALALPSLALVLCGVFLSFSRGSWGAATVSCAMVVVSTFLTYREGGTRKRILTMGIVVLAVMATALLVILSTDSVREFFLQRFTLAQDYDSGETGRFGNQMRSIPMLLERPLGFGPLRYRLVFDLDPHNSYIGAFANGGWLGGFSWLLLIGMTVYMGFRLMISPSPYRIYAQAVFPATLCLLLQGFQIDIDHWRQFSFLVGLTWGLEAARRRWVSGQQDASVTAAPAQKLPA